MAALGMHPRLAHMVLRAHGLGLARLACEIAAVLSERDPVRGGPGTPDPDLRTRLDALHGRALPHGVTADRGATAPHRACRAADRATTRSVAAIAPRQWPQRSPTPTAAGLLLAFAYPDRIGRARAETGGRYALSGGRGAVLPGPAALARSEYIVVAALDAGEREARIQLAAPLDPQRLEEHFADRIEESTLVEWDPRSETVAARRLRRLGQLVLREEPLHRLGAAADPGDARRRPLTRPALPAVDARPRAMARTSGVRCAPMIRWAASAGPTSPTPRCSMPPSRGSRPGSTASRGATSWPASTCAPRCMRCSTGTRSSDWTVSRRRTSACRAARGSRSTIPAACRRSQCGLQEVFGLAESPRIAEGRVPVTLELLSPARRPVQVTRDLESFWSRGYHEVRKELKGRYPKHYWPDDPREATATRRVRPPGT